MITWRKAVNGLPDAAGKNRLSVISLVILKLWTGRYCGLAGRR
ncbi:Uncharacterised protein [Escherichia coli]|nr:Uncharacterised protein [Escherichia coli]